ncbi:aldehyde dehydrogenase family protein [Naasia sp. SYSU D00057]|uniref:aldehyde dehydrogenase family protein n=1 Tax=Naasia sp. SYSU D00057 TaxID=2817380 RepID=UPI001B3160EE|nr:aldehyde dehydrogenase family protein [Naasia sp. SYSU D00057]
MTGTATTPQELDAALDAAVAASRRLSALTLPERGDLLRRIADALEGAPDLAETAADETSLAVERMRGELARTVGQFRLYAEVMEEGSWLDASITHAIPDATPPIPDLRRINVPLGPVLVFAASNFPLAFGVLGTDTAAALAVGCAVVAKPHPGHPRLGERLSAVVGAALEASGAPEGVFSLVVGDDLAVTALRDARIAAGAFTGSIRGGTALLEVAGDRPRPIPFYAEMGSVNPVVVTEQAIAARKDEILDGFLASLTINVGQLCTSPGVLFVPDGSVVPADLAGRIASVGAAPMLTPAIASGFRAGQERLAEAGILAAVGEESAGEGLAAPRLWFGTAASALEHPEVLEEVFGPSAVVLGYRTLDEVLAVVDAMDGQLTGTIWAEEGGVPSGLAAALTERCGRVLLNGWPTGVAVTWSTHHGGPWPSASSAKFGSVGAESLARFVRPVAYQGFADADLPEPLRDETTWRIPRRVDAAMTHAKATLAG